MRGAAGTARSVLVDAAAAAAAAQTVGAEARSEEHLQKDTNE